MDGPIAGRRARRPDNIRPYPYSRCSPEPGSYADKSIVPHRTVPIMDGSRRKVHSDILQGHPPPRTTGLRGRVLLGETPRRCDSS